MLFIKSIFFFNRKFQYPIQKLHHRFVVCRDIVAVLAVIFCTYCRCLKKKKEEYI